MHGWINVLKAPGCTSHDVVQQVRRILPGVKVGHSGTLDPAAAGVLVLAVGSLTRLVEEVGNTVKGYRAIMVLGLTTSSEDQTGQVLSQQPFPQISVDELRQVFPAFTGRIEQVPPMVSAVHYQGKRLYELARQGREVRRVARQVTIYRLDILKADFDRSYPLVTVDVLCSKGTYIRTLCADIGKVLGCGASLGFLLRYQVGPFVLESAYSLEEIQDKSRKADCKFLLPPASGLAHLPVLRVRPEQVAGVLNGRVLFLAENQGSVVLKHGEKVRLEDESGLLAIGIVQAQGPNLLVKIDKVLAIG